MKDREIFLVHILMISLQKMQSNSSCIIYLLNFVFLFSSFCDAVYFCERRENLICFYCFKKIKRVIINLHIFKVDMKTTDEFQVR